MSATNKALLNITKQKLNEDDKKTLFPANVPDIESRYKAPFFFAIGVVSSLCLIGWASVNHSFESVQENIDIASIPSNEINSLEGSDASLALFASSPTTKSTIQEVSSIYIEPSQGVIDVVKAQEKAVHKKQGLTSSPPEQIVNVDTEVPALKSASVIPNTVRENASEEFYVQEVELLPSELAKKSREAASKSLDRSDFKSAIKEFYTVLKYQPNDEESRKKLAALLYGKRNVKEAASVLQQGIKLDHDSVSLRLALASLLQKEEQSEAALSVLEYVPVEASIDYLATRGGLAQKLKFIDLAEESYQTLVVKAPENGRWWLGLAIAYERKAQTKEAYKTYKIALMTPGLSRSSQAFVRDRIKLLATMEGNE